MTYTCVTVAPDSIGESSPKSHQMLISSPSGSNGSVVKVTVVLALTVRSGSAGTNGAEFSSDGDRHGQMNVVLSWMSHTYTYAVTVPAVSYVCDTVNDTSSSDKTGPLSSTAYVPSPNANVNLLES